MQWCRQCKAAIEPEDNHTGKFGGFRCPRCHLACQLVPMDQAERESRLEECCASGNWRGVASLIGFESESPTDIMVILATIAYRINDAINKEVEAYAPDKNGT